MTTKQATIKKTTLKRFTSIIAIAIMLFALAIPCLAWDAPPITPTGSYSFTYGFYYTLNSDSGKVVACAYGNDLNVNNYLVLLDTEIVDVLDNDFIVSNCTYHPLTLNIPSQEFANSVIINYQTNSLNSFTPSLDRLYSDAYNEGYEVGELAGYNWGYDIGEENGYNEGVRVSYDVGYDNGYSDGYRQGETNGLDASETGKNLILTIFSVPTYVLSNVFNFEIFGINLYSLICFLLTISIVGIVLKKIL